MEQQAARCHYGVVVPCMASGHGRLCSNPGWVDLGNFYLLKCLNINVELFRIFYFLSHQELSVFTSFYEDLCGSRSKTLVVSCVKRRQPPCIDCLFFQSTVMPRGWFVKRGPHTTSVSDLDPQGGGWERHVCLLVLKHVLTAQNLWHGNIFLWHIWKKSLCMGKALGWLVMHR